MWTLKYEELTNNPPEDTLGMRGLHFVKPGCALHWPDRCSADDEPVRGTCELPDPKDPRKERILPAFVVDMDAPLERLVFCAGQAYKLRPYDGDRKHDETLGGNLVAQRLVKDYLAWKAGRPKTLESKSAAERREAEDAKAEADRIESEESAAAKTKAKNDAEKAEADRDAKAKAEKAESERVEAAARAAEKRGKAKV